jgi:hypothetical protein
MLLEESPEKFCDVLQRLEGEGARYVVVSGVAVVLHGHIRPVLDLDVVVDPAPPEAQRTLRALTLAGFIPSIPLPLEMLTVLRLLDRSGREVDVFARYPIPFAELWRDAEIRNIGGQAVRIASLQHLLKAKRFNNRPHDLSDIEGLMKLAICRALN